MSSSAKKITSLTVLKSKIRSLKARGRKIVFTNGTFDLLHVGHVTYLEKAKTFGDILVIGVNTDRSVKSYKTPDRPYNCEQDRLRVLAALACVDFVTLFDQPTPIKLILELEPDILVKGADWKISQIAGAKEVVSWGGQVKLVRLVPGRSTTNILERIKDNLSFPRKRESRAPSGSPPPRG